MPLLSHIKIAGEPEKYDCCEKISAPEKDVFARLSRYFERATMVFDWFYIRYKWEELERPTRRWTTTMKSGMTVIWNRVGADSNKYFCSAEQLKAAQRKNSNISQRKWVNFPEKGTKVWILANTWTWWGHTTNRKGKLSEICAVSRQLKSIFPVSCRLRHLKAYNLSHQKKIIQNAMA